MEDYVQRRRRTGCNLAQIMPFFQRQRWPNLSRTTKEKKKEMTTTISSPTGVAPIFFYVSTTTQRSRSAAAEGAKENSVRAHKQDSTTTVVN
jgi:hypothetical protein